MRRVIPAAAVAAAAVLTASGCAGSGSSNLGGAASVVPSNTVAFVAVDSSLSAREWQAVDALLQGFPSLLAKIRALGPALGSELDVAELPGDAIVGLTQPADASKLSAALAEADPPLVTRKVGAWTAFSQNAGALDAVASATATLASDSAYRDAIATLPGDVLVRAYANGAEALQLLGSLPGQTQVQTTTPTSRRLRLGHSGGGAIAGEQFLWGSAVVVAVPGGLKLEAHARPAPPAPSVFQRSYEQAPVQPYVARLPDEIPSGALLVADVQVATGTFELTDPSTLPRPLEQLLASNPNLAGQLDSILGGETALYVRPSLPTAEVTLVTQPPDTQAAVSALDAVLPTLKLGGARVFHAVVGGELVISTSQQGIADFRSAGAKLSSDSAFRRAGHAAGMPAATTGFVYANLKAGLPLVQTLAPLTGVTVPSQQPLQSLTAFATRSGGLASYTVFLAAQ
jgi:hypothetical protein